MNHWNDIDATISAAGWVLYPLTGLAIAALAITFDRAYALWRFARVPDVADASDDPALAVDRLPRGHALRRIAPFFADGALPIPQIEARVEAAALRIEREMSRGLWLLETIVTAAPLVGLLGTIVGMMHAFRLIGGDGLVNPSGVTGGVAQALIATALGLVIALVALFAFNYFARRIDRLMEDVEIFANERLAVLRVAAERSGRSGVAR
ncbi:outer membrane transport energization protein ExbB [Paraburkholderia caballeronis]|uniref:MotA/TolQ/ExbB proton channel family protein n=1 Tax=Paraburkholderia caballeronis TaxID=416943 RepID=UPI001065B27D|nr:MotA/TolQ/ExbB proton channel family protein [Paraburkholderia caballeronis]TDV39051.1 outer membrane transport energization protein ExbB [Paraburkholderia caballeronis]